MNIKSRTGNDALDQHSYVKASVLAKYQRKKRYGTTRKILNVRPAQRCLICISNFVAPHQLARMSPKLPDIAVFF